MSSNEQIYLLDGNNFTNLVEFTEEVGQVLGVDPAWLEAHYEQPWRGNLDVFMGMLYWPVTDRSQFPAVRTDLKYVLVWKHSDLSREHFGYAARENWLRMTLPFVHTARSIERITQAIEAAQQHIGMTLFDLIVRIIERRGEEFIKLRLE